MSEDIVKKTNAVFAFNIKGKLNVNYLGENIILEKKVWGNNGTRESGYNGSAKKNNDESFIEQYTWKIEFVYICIFISKNRKWVDKSTTSYDMLDFKSYVKNL